MQGCRSWGSNPGRVKRFFLFSRNVHTVSGAHPTSSSVVTAVPSRGESGRDVKLTTHLYLVQRLRKSGAIPLLPLYAYMALTQGKLYLLPYAKV
jgi:hypothetical protein